MDWNGTALARRPSAPALSHQTALQKQDPTGERPLSADLQPSLWRLLGEPRHVPLWVSALRRQIACCGICDRPGSREETLWLYLKESEQPRAVRVGEALWMDFDPALETLRARWSEQICSALRAEVVAIQSDRITMQVAKKSELHSFFPIELTFDRSPRERPWEIGSHLVDGRLLMKMEARWFGPDQLLTELTGTAEPAQHLQFGFGSRAYALPLEMGGILHWSEGRWHRGFAEDCPLLRLESSDAGKLNLTVWDATGFHRSDLSLTKLFSPTDLNGISSQIKFKGLRGQKRAQITLGAQTLVARQGDWIVKKQEGWSLLSTAESRRQWLLNSGAGEVVAIQAIERRKGRPRLIAKIYNASHVESVTAELALTLPPVSAPNLTPHP
jgi:hypothetical protein